MGNSSTQSREAKVLFFGLGNPILADDAVGIRAVEELSRRIKRPNCEFKTGSIGGLKILDEIQGYDRVVFVDAIVGDEPGKFYELSLERLSRSFHLTSPHSVNLFTALELGRGLGLKMPEEIKIYVMEIKDGKTFGEEFPEEVAARFPDFVEFVFQKEIGGDHAS